MGQKVNPKSYRTGVIYAWPSRWFGKRNFSDLLEADVRLRKFLKNKLKEAMVGDIEIERSANKVHVIIHSARPGLVIGRKGTGIDEIKNEVVKKFFTKVPVNLQLTIEEIKQPNLDANV